MDSDVRAAARRLAAAWNAQRSIDALPPGEKPATLDTAYAIQRQLQEETSEPSAGWKIAGASMHGLRASPSGQALFGFLRGSCVHASGVTLAMPPGGVTLEVEIAVRFGQEVAPATTPFDPALIDEAFVAIEVVRSRFHDRKAVGQPSFIADAAGGEFNRSLQHILRRRVLRWDRRSMVAASAAFVPRWGQWAGRTWRAGRPSWRSGSSSLGG